ncbi:MAG: sigma-54 dependent transcriptional regulator, partial [bacterium]|nr:sigma-54 dependent transcriptional regulator [bacterium]
MSALLLLVEDDPRYGNRLKKNLELEGYSVLFADCGEDALQIFMREPIDLVLTDIKMPGMDGLELLKRIGELQAAEAADVPVVLLTSVDSVRVAVDAMKAGAADYITKDADRDEIMLRVEKVLRGAQVRAENRSLKKHMQSVAEPSRFIATSPLMQDLLAEIEAIADAGARVLIVGETGVGKEIIARAIHQKSPRASQSFIDVNCAAIPSDNLFQSEVFGHEKGAFTGATTRKQGKLELANEGTLFLDEIGDMPLESQGKILRAIETQEFERLGGNQKIRVNIAVIAATNKELQREVDEGRFRQDLLYRLDIIRLRVPPLRERQEDILPLTEYFFALYAQKYHRSIPTITADARRGLESYAWPGNVRELKNLVERIVIRNRQIQTLDASTLAKEGLGEEKSYERPA